MKTKKWLWITLTAIPTLVVLAGVGAAGYRLGLTQNPAVIQQLADLRAQRLNQLPKQGADQGPQGNNNGINPQEQGFNPHSNLSVEITADAVLTDALASPPRSLD